MSDNSKRSGVPVTTVIFLIVITALSVAVVMLLLERRNDPSSVFSSLFRDRSWKEVEIEVRDSGDAERSEAVRVLDDIGALSDARPAAEELIEEKLFAEEETIGKPAEEDKSEEEAPAADIAEEKPADEEKAEEVPFAAERTEETRTAPIESDFALTRDGKPEAVSEYADPMKACLFVKGIDASGTGFPVLKDGKVFVLTCWHVVDDQPVLIITDADGKEYKVKKILVAKDRDLAAVEVEASPEEILCLPLRASAGDLAADTGIVCYGAPVGTDVVGNSEGKILASGPVNIAIDAPAAVGCGGPVTLKGTNLVVGVASLLNRTGETEKRLAQGSLMEPETKRFCVRADNLDWNKLEESGSGKNDLKAVNKRAKEALEANDLKRAEALLFYSAKNGDKEAAELWCDLASKILASNKNQPALGNFTSESFKFLKEAAAGGSPDAALDLGVCYLYGIGTAKDPAEGFAKIDEAVKLGSVKALYMKGFCQYSGIGAPKNTAEAFESFKQGAEKGDVLCMRALGSYYLNDNRPSEAFAWYEKAAKSGDPEAIFAVGILYESGYGVAKNPDLAYENYQKSARMGHAPAQVKMGKLQEKKGAYPSAAYWFDLAAQKLDAEAVEKLGFYYLRGTGGKPEDADTAAHYLAYAAQFGRAGAMTFMGNRSCDLKNYERAFEWYRKAVAKEDPEAIYRLGLLYENGHGVPKDDFKAFKCFKLAAEKDNEDAWINLGINYLLGRGTDEDQAQARQWIEKAAKAGKPVGQMILGDIYCNGWGVPEDQTTAAYWYERSSQAGVAEAGEKLAQLRRREAEEKEKQQAQIKAWETEERKKQEQVRSVATESAEKQAPSRIAETRISETPTAQKPVKTENVKKQSRALYRVKETMEKPAQNQYKSPYSKEVDKPMLELKVTGPTRTKVGDRFNYVVRVKNSGTGTAKNVTITNKLPWGISLTSDPETKNFTMKAGDMVPGCVKTFTFEAAPDFAGIFIDYVSASGANAHVKHSSLCTKVINRR